MPKTSSTKSYLRQFWDFFMWCQISSCHVRAFFMSDVKNQNSSREGNILDSFSNGWYLFFQLLDSIIPLTRQLNALHNLLKSRLAMDILRPTKIRSTFFHKPVYPTDQLKVLIIICSCLSNIYTSYVILCPRVFLQHCYAIYKVTLIWFWYRCDS